MRVLKSITRERVAELVKNNNLLVLIYFLFLSAFILIKLNPFALSIDVLFFLFFGAAAILGSFKKYLHDFFPFILFLFGYEALRGIADTLIGRVNITNLIELEQAIFGTIPTIFFQDLWYVPSGRFYDAIAIFAYASHFYLYFLFAFWLWRKHKDTFHTYLNGFIFLSFLALITYVLFPAMPPWLASQQGYLPPVHRIIDEQWNALLGHRIGFTSALQFVGVNDIAAMPSLHAAWPFYTSFFTLYFFGRRFWWVFILPLLVSVSAVYLGEHYVIDIIAGALYALLAFGLVVRRIDKETVGE